MSKIISLPKVIASIITLALILLLSYPVMARDATSSTTGKDVIQKRVDTRKENTADRVTVMKERAATKEAALKVRLETFKDRKKAEATDRLNQNLTSLNKKVTEQMLKYLDRMRAILTKLEARVNSAKPDVKDVSTAKEAIADAGAVINSATAAVSSQAEKDYTITVSSETKVKGDIQKVRVELHTDLKTIRQMVVDAKQALANAIRVAKSGKQDLPVKEGTPGGR